MLASVRCVVLLVLVGSAIEQLRWWAGRQRAVAVRLLDCLTALRRNADPVPQETHAAALRAISDTMSTILDVDSCRLTLDDHLPATVLHGDASITRAGRTMDVNTDGLSTDDVIAIPVPPADNRPAYFAVTAATHVAQPRPERRQVAAPLVHLAADSITLEAGASGRAASIRTGE